VLDQPAAYAGMRAEARRTIVERYALAKLLPRQLQFIMDIVNYGRPSDPAEPGKNVALP